MELEYNDWMGLFDLFTTKTELLPKWNDDKPDWMKEPYMVTKGNRMTVCATNGASIIFVDYSLLQHGIYKFPILDKYPKIPTLVPKSKRKTISGYDVVANVLDVSDKPYNINILEGCYLPEFWKPIKAAMFTLGSSELTLLTKPSKTELLLMQVVDGVRCGIMPFQNNN